MRGCGRVCWGTGALGDGGAGAGEPRARRVLMLTALHGASGLTKEFPLESLGTQRG